jgi:hypothetical protein
MSEIHRVRHRVDLPVDRERNAFHEKALGGGASRSSPEGTYDSSIHGTNGRCEIVVMGRQEGLQ